MTAMYALGVVASGAPSSSMAAAAIGATGSGNVGGFSSVGNGMGATGVVSNANSSASVYRHVSPASVSVASSSAMSPSSPSPSSLSASGASAASLSGASSGQLNPAALLLIASKLLYVTAVFMFADYASSIPSSLLAFMLALIASVAFLFAQKPFATNKKSLSWKQTIRVGIFSGTNALSWLLWASGVMLCGPVRAVVLSNVGDAAISALGASIFRRSTRTSSNGVWFILAGILVMVLFDYPSSLIHHSIGSSSASSEETVDVTDETGDHHPAKHSSYPSIMFGLSDHTYGVLLLVIAAVLSAFRKNAARKLSVETGGAKRLNALSSLLSVGFMFPWAMYSYGSSSMDESIQLTSLGTLVPCLYMSAVLFVGDYYIESFASAKMDGLLLAKRGYIAAFFGAFAYSIIWPTHSGPSGVMLASFVLILLGLQMLSLLEVKDTRDSHGSILGLSSAGLPLYNAFGSGIDSFSASVAGHGMSWKQIIHQILENQDSRQIFYFLCLNLVFMFVEFLYGYWTNSLGLMTDGFHMLFDCTALAVGLYAAVISKWKGTKTFSYGFGRVEILSGFVNGIFLVFIAVFVFSEAVERIMQPPEITTDRLLLVSVFGLCVNLVGMFAFQHAHSHGGAACDHGHSHDEGGGGGEGHKNANMEGVFLHVLADTLGSVGVIVSSLLIQFFGWYIADPVCSLFIATLIFFSVLPLLRQSSLLLLQRTPQDMEKTLQAAVQKIFSLDGVVAIREPHFWSHAPDVMVGTLHVKITPQTIEGRVLSAAVHALRSSGITDVCVQIEKDEFLAHTSIRPNWYLFKAVGNGALGSSATLSLPSLSMNVH